jgi:pimeloyl-ACP methyl ester carboxylesterase
MELPYSSLTAELHYTCVGRGADVLLIHGWASSGRMWSRLAQELKHQFRFWMVDLCGFGASPLPDGDNSPDLELHTATLIEFCQVHNIRPDAIIGHSMGGMLALKMAVSHPDLMRRLVLMSPVVTGRFGNSVELNRLLTSDLGKFAISCSKPLWSFFQLDIFDVFTPMMMIPWFAHREAALRIRQDFKRADWQAITAALDSIARENLESHLSQLPHPALVIMGSRDTTVPPHEGRLAASLLPNGRLLELPAIYHQPLDEAPQTVVQAVNTFLTES